MPESVHHKLREMLDLHPMGCPPANAMEMGMQLLQEKGKLEGFIKLNTL
jgi:hypothetical protein